MLSHICCQLAKVETAQNISAQEHRSIFQSAIQCHFKRDCCIGQCQKLAGKSRKVRGLRHLRGGNTTNFMGHICIDPTRTKSRYTYSLIPARVSHALTETHQGKLAYGIAGHLTFDPLSTHRYQNLNSTFTRTTQLRPSRLR